MTENRTLDMFPDLRRLMCSKQRTHEWSGQQEERWGIVSIKRKGGGEVEEEEGFLEDSEKVE